MQGLEMIDNGGRRIGFDRRQLSITVKGGERRSDNERRSGKERRKKWTYQGDRSNERRCSFLVDVHLNR